MPPVQSYPNHRWAYDHYDLDITGVIIEQGITEIGPGAFDHCYNLSYVVIPDSVTSIGRAAFYRNNLVSVSIPNSVTFIDEKAFEECKNLESVTLPVGIESIGDNTFANCNSLTNISLPEGIKSIGDYAFYRCESLNNLTIPNSVTSIGLCAFAYCSNITALTIPSNVNTISAAAFTECSSLSKIIFEGNAPVISNKIFANGTVGLVTGTAYYPDNNVTWTEDVMSSFGGNITWIPYTEHEQRGLVSKVPTVATKQTTQRDDADNLRTINIQNVQNDPKASVDSASTFSIREGEYESVSGENYTLKTASFTDLVPCEQYVLLALAKIDVENPLDFENLLYIKQASSLDDGTLKFQYIQVQDLLLSYVMVSGASNSDLRDATITFPEMIADGEPQAIEPTIVFNGKTLTEGKDYVIVILKQMLNTLLGLGLVAILNQKTACILSVLQKRLQQRVCKSIKVILQ